MIPVPAGNSRVNMLREGIAAIFAPPFRKVRELPEWRNW